MKLVLMTEWKRMYFSFSHFVFCFQLPSNSFFCSLSFLGYFSWESWDFNLLDILYAFICVILSCYSKRKTSTKWDKFSNTVHFRFSEEVPFFVKINHFHADSESFWKKNCPFRPLNWLFPLILKYVLWNHYTILSYLYSFLKDYCINLSSVYEDF